MTHASNLTGTILPIEEAGRLCKKYGLYFIIDSAQTAGTIDIDFQEYNIDVLTFTGHKGLFGPQGIGGFLISDRADRVTSPFIEGGTGSSSHMEIQPDILPDKYESGTANTVGIAGLKAGIEFIKKTGMENIRKHENTLAQLLIDGFQSIDGVCIYGPKDTNKQTSTVSINIKEMDPSEVSYILDSNYGIMTRSGIHCTPSAHRTIGTFPRGTVRFSIGYFNTEEEIKQVLDAVREISKLV
jgi:selenocysteine lyase/cysteine desulfurase